MKKIIRLTESQFIKVIKLIKESLLLDKTNFKSDGIGSFILKETSETIEYQLLNNNGKIRFVIIFYKKNVNNMNKVQIVCINEEDKIAYDMVTYFDSELKKFESMSKIIDTGTEYYIEYMIDSNSIEEFKRIVENTLSEIELDEF